VKRRHQVNHDLLLPGLHRKKRPAVVWSASVIAALGLTGALAIPLVAQPADTRQGNVQVSMDAVADASLAYGPVFVSVDAPLNAFGASGRQLAIDGRPIGMVAGALDASEVVEAETVDAEQSAESEEENTASTALLAGTVGEIGKLPGDLQLMHPVTSRRISSPYGWRSNPTGAGNQIHIGQDYPVSCGSPVYASEDGTVSVSGWAGHSGMRVSIDHGSNIQTGYSHNSKLIAKVGQHVQQGELIALAGTTGNSTGCHVHFEVIIDGRWHDPRNYLPLIPGQRQAMINSQRLTVGANSAPKSGAPRSSAPSTNQPDPDIIVPENDTPYIPSPAPKPRPVPTKTVKPTPTHSETKTPTPTKSPSTSTAPPESTTKAPSPSAKPAPSTSPTKIPSPTPTTKAPEPTTSNSVPPVQSSPDKKPITPAPTVSSTQEKKSGASSPTGSEGSSGSATPSTAGSASSSASITQ